MSDPMLAQAARLLDLLAPQHALITGARRAALAELVAGHQHARGAVLHVAALPPPQWAGALRAKAGDSVVFHEAAPAVAVSVLPVPGIAWLDGDENYFTVHAVLAAMDAQATRLGRSFPVTLVSGAGWPHGRRDGYENPADIPPGMCHAHERAGLIPGQSAPAGGGGLHAGEFHSTAENEPGIGVLTAIEDFVTARVDRLRFTLLPGFGGCAVIAPLSGPGAAAVAPALLLGDALAMAGALDAARLAALVDIAGARAEAARAAATVEKLKLALRQAMAGQTADIARPPSLRAAAGRAKLLGKLALRGRLAAHRAAERAAMAEAEAAHRLRLSPVFDAVWYQTQYRDVAEAGLDPALHYLRAGAAEGRDPGPYFSTAYYRANYPDVAASGANPLLHYLDNGGVEGRNPGPRFAGGLYLAQNPDVAQAKLNPLEHWLVSGRGEGRAAPPAA